MSSYLFCNPLPHSRPPSPSHFAHIPRSGTPGGLLANLSVIQKCSFFSANCLERNPSARSRLRYSSAPTQVRKGEKNSPFPPSIPKDTFAWSETFPPTARTGLEAIGGTDKGLHSILMKCHFRCAGENTERASEGVVCHHLNPASRSNKTVMLAPARIVTCH